MFRVIIKTLIIGFCAALFAFSFNVFLLPHQLMSGGVTGIAALISHYTHINSGWIFYVLNIPLFFLGFVHLGRKFVFYTVYAVTILSLSMRLIPIFSVTDDILLSSVIGGALYGLGVGIIIRLGSSTGGLDIVSLIISKRTNIPLGYLNIFMNLLIVLCSGFVFGWDIALYTIITIYVAGRAIDMVYTNQNKLTLTIVTDKAELLCEELIKLNSRGITITEAKGAYTNNNKRVLTTVITKYELSETKEKIREVDGKAFVNITQTLEVMGHFRKS